MFAAIGHEWLLIQSVAAAMAQGGCLGLFCGHLTGAVIHSYRRRSGFAFFAGTVLASFPGTLTAAITGGLLQAMILPTSGMGKHDSWDAPAWANVLGWLFFPLVISTAATAAVLALPTSSPSATTPTRFRRWLAFSVWCVLSSVVAISALILGDAFNDATEMRLAIFPGIALGVFVTAAWQLCRRMLLRDDSRQT